MKGRKVAASGMGEPSAHGALRATSSRVRESVFNIVGPSIDDMVFVDLYAGTGTVGMEAMSRGASRVYFIESDIVRWRELLKMLEGCGCQVRAVIRNSTAADFVSKSLEGDVDVFFLDPPYDSDELINVLPLIAESASLTDETRVLAEHRSSMTLPDEFGRLYKKKTYKYGDTTLSLYRVRH